MNFKGVNINRLQGGLGRQAANTDSVLALAVVADFSGTDLTVGTPVKLIQPEDAEAYGIDEAFDANESSLAHYHITEFFRLAPEGTLYLIPLSDTDTVATMHTALVPILKANQDIKGLGVVGTASVISELEDLVEGVQTNLVDALFAGHRYLDFVLLEGNGDEEEPFATIAAYPDFRAKNAPQVSVVIAQDPAIAETDEAYSGHAGVGSVLGMIAVRKVNENAGSVNIQNKPDGAKGTADYPLTGNGRWESAQLSTGKPISELSYADYKALADKGYIVAGAYSGYAGIFLNGSATCVNIASDYAYIENNRVWNKAARGIRKALLPEVKGVVKKDPQTGFIKSTTISRWEGIAGKPLDQMLADGEISGYDIYINPQQSLSNDESLKVKARVVKDDIVHEFDVDLGLAKNLS